VYGRPLHFTGDELPPHRDTASCWTIWPGREWLAARCRSGFNVITSPEVMLRRSVVDRVGGQQALAHTHDMEMWLRVSAFCDVAYVHGADQAWHRDHDNSLSAREVDGVRDLTERRDAFSVLFSGPAGGLAEARALHDAAKSALAAHAVELAKRQFDHANPNMAMVATFRDLARSLSVDADKIPGWVGLNRRMGMRPDKALRDPIFFLERTVRGLRSRYSRWKWARVGEYL
jgi:hypothetical protein